MVKNMNISIIIPTWNRKRLLIEAIENFLLQLKDSINFEILICDSNSSDGTEEWVRSHNRKHKNLYLKILHSKCNNISAKRNLGILNAKYDNLILTDDDCIPLDNFINIYKYFLDKGNTKKIFCGQYRTENISKSNYARYRDSRNIIFANDDQYHLIELKFNNMVTGNMAFNKKFVIENNILFNEFMTGYGFEDIDWAFRLKNNGFSLFLTQANVNHKETSYGISKYKIKWFYVGKYAMPLLMKYNLEAAKNLTVFKAEIDKHNHIMMTICIFTANLFLINPFINLIEFILNKTDNIRLAYFPIMYKIVIAKSYYKGVRSRKINSIKQENSFKDWFSKGYK